jgi:CheY-like chemotaxis protein
LRVLIAEDDPDIWIPYKIALEKRGHTVDVAQNGEECIEIYKTSFRNVIRDSTTTNKDNYYYYYYYSKYQADDDDDDSINKSRANSDYHNDHALSSSTYNSSLLFSPTPSPPPYDAVVLDYRMPKKDGLKAAKEILALYPSQRIIFASAYVEETLRESIKELSQIVELMQKPFLPEALVEVIEDIEAYPELKKLFINVRKMTESDFENPSPAQIKDILEGLKKIQKGRTF